MLLRTTHTNGIANTVSFRLGSRAVFKRGNQFKGFGTNLQNRSPLESRIYIPSHPDSIFLQADQSGAEALIVSYLTKPGKYRDLFKYKIKPHSFIGLSFPKHWESVCPNIRELRKLEIKDLAVNEDWKKLDKIIKKSDSNPPKTRFYYIYKQTCHSGNYGVEPPALQLNTLIKSEGAIYLPMNESIEYLESYHGLFPEIREWQREVRMIGERTRCIRNMFGYPRTFEGQITDKTFKEMYAQCPQSTVACITHKAYTSMQHFIEENGFGDRWHLLVQKHDSILMETPEEDREIAGRVLQSSLEQKLCGRDGVEFYMRSEVSWGRNWAKQTNDNPDGMRDLC